MTTLSPLLRSQARVVLCIIGILACYNITNSVRAHLPPVSYHLWINDYLVISMIISVSALLEYALVQYFLQSETTRRAILKKMEDTGIGLVEKIEEHARYLHVDFVDVCHDVYLRQERFIRVIAGKASAPSARLEDGNPIGEAGAGASAAVKPIEGKEGEKATPPPKRFTRKEITNIYASRRIFIQFDEDSSGLIDTDEFRKALRHFGYFFSKVQVAECIHDYHLELKDPAAGSVADDLELDFKGLMVLLSSKISPPEDLDRDIWSHPPSLICDLVARRVFPLIVASKILIMSLAVEYY
mmetsp:Transcript_22968/g.71414  ORF Transcript_22968/g.71414 Transcript_22968/m.71414 type:complete len:299 (-) Transcript_22968:181-1077(-)